MSIKIRALLQTLGIILGIISISVIASLVMSFITAEIGIYLVVLGFFALFGSLIYSVVLGRLEYDQAVDKIHDKIAEKTSNSML